MVLKGVTPVGWVVRPRNWPSAQPGNIVLPGLLGPLRWEMYRRRRSGSSLWEEEEENDDELLKNTTLDTVDDFYLSVPAVQFLQKTSEYFKDSLIRKARLKRTSL